ncbi:hypothetical protein SERLA73DRAFT_189112 [Serpula lacrymans var. lacrymans S7.3]|uniref:N-acetyltransferase domain-containing protein n=2 Tax=Serpula lacrymans var. lacrymans TaxID=341189 RepID=F8QCV7_SERL3|nr:uncharacterized protein SERLADRAFT_479792 [Serpula lacrymans var. lacrymans S7.9]EGN93972.1 hypothetical protein SERLA73DRAFT_189112 [Serpula lacrymans var. lacrymans S7.3]EGO19338.1 hypothetical protein SERLADRAFT_479792 [Serpula lacrymans var. lacrymans S7.9]
MVSPQYDIFTLERPLTDTTIAKFSTFRLLALKTDPAAFASTYARELAFSREVWRELLDSPHQATFVAAVRGELINGDEWVATVTVVAPSALPPGSLEPFQTAGVRAGWDIYHFVAMWVHPEHRGNGLGRKLVASLLEWVQNHDDGPKNDNKDKVVTLMVAESNESARALYDKMGFEEIQSMRQDKGFVWMMSHIVEHST